MLSVVVVLAVSLFTVPQVRKLKVTMPAHWNLVDQLCPSFRPAETTLPACVSLHIPTPRIANTGVAAAISGSGAGAVVVATIISSCAPEVRRIACTAAKSEETISSSGGPWAA